MFQTKSPAAQDFPQIYSASKERNSSGPAWFSEPQSYPKVCWSCSEAVQRSSTCEGFSHFCWMLIMFLRLFFSVSLSKPPVNNAKLHLRTEKTHFSSRKIKLLFLLSLLWIISGHPRSYADMGWTHKQGFSDICASPELQQVHSFWWPSCTPRQKRSPDPHYPLCHQKSHISRGAESAWAALYRSGLW